MKHKKEKTNLVKNEVLSVLIPQNQPFGNLLDTFVAKAKARSNYINSLYDFTKIRCECDSLIATNSFAMVIIQSNFTKLTEGLYEIINGNKLLSFHNKDYKFPDWKRIVPTDKDLSFVGEFGYTKESLLFLCIDKQVRINLYSYEKQIQSMLCFQFMWNVYKTNDEALYVIKNKKVNNLNVGENTDFNITILMKTYNKG